MSRVFRKTKKFLYVVLGIALLIVGIMGLVLPILPGIVLILFGLVAMSRGSSRIHESKLNRRLVGYMKKIAPKTLNSLL